MNNFSIFMRGIVKENPVLILLLGLCPALAVSTQAENALGMGIATTFVLVCSNLAISLLRNVIPDKVRIPCYIVLISGFVTLVQMIVEAYAYTLYQALGIFLPLIATNCVIFGRAEVFANKNNAFKSLLDAIGMGAGFTLALLLIASVREIFGSGTWFGIEIPILISNNIPILTLAPGGFVVFGFLVAVVNKFSKTGTRNEFGCKGCPQAKACGKGGTLS
ncbi:MAG: electron transport complex subunit E [Lachnospiraceae bacterium]|nr:electron transport complex subunit E [Lachnospiraceae bacterium]